MIACPKCRGRTGLWSTMVCSGWHSIEVTKDGDRRVVREATHGHPHFEVDTFERELEPSSGIGCSCGWEGYLPDLVELGTDGEPLPAVAPGQLGLSL